MFDFGVDSFIWSEKFSEKELGFTTFDVSISDPYVFPVDLAGKAARETGLHLVTTTTRTPEATPIDPDPKIRGKAVDWLKKMVDINMVIGSKLVAGVIYAAWGYLPGRPRTEDEWKWSVDTIRKAAEYAAAQGDVELAFEPVNRFETHFLNIASDAVQLCKDVGPGNVKVHLDTFHMIREETSCTEAVEVCGKEYLGYVHACENNRGIPGTGLVPWVEFFQALKDIGYEGSVSIESFDPSFEVLNSLCAIWRRFAESGEVLAVEGLKNLKAIAGL